ncbi:MAG: hypothetical protein N2321_06940 [Melioribacteraceae bacterium]|nr:hypothetical protein [Melioribacteraceae bacterium]
MKNDINITEEDLFYFIFDKNKLELEKISYLNKNIHLYEDEINILKSLNEINPYNSVSESSTIENITILIPSKSNNFDYSTPINLAAATVELKEHDLAHSYVDSKSEYLIRIIELDDRNLLYLITDKELPQKIKIQIFPSGHEYFIKDNIQPIEILKEYFIEKIVIF